MGTQAPDFELEGHKGSKWRLSDQKGKQHSVIAFYPFAFSPVCSSQVPGLERNLQRFEQHDAQVVGISIDSKYSNKAWSEAIGGITYPLLSDFWPHGEVTRKYGVLDEAAGRSERAVIIVDKEGMVRYIDVHEIGEQPDEDQILEEVAKIQSEVTA